MKDISNSEDYLDVRDIIERFEELEEEREGLASNVEEAKEAEAAAEIFYNELDEPTEEAKEEAQGTWDYAQVETSDARKALEEWDDDYKDELDTLGNLLSELCGNGGDHQWKGDWYPVTLIRDSYFEESMDDMLEDIGAMPKDIPCYLTITVDYDALKMDYTSVEFDGVTYWYR